MEININKYINKFFNFNKFIFIEEKECITLIADKEEVIELKTDDFNKIKYGILSDSLIDIKVITIPIVSHNILKNIVINTIKKYTSIIPNEENTDFLILDKIDNQYEILVFIKLHEEIQDYPKLNYYTSYHLMQNIVNNKDFPEDASIITNIDNIWFLYKFKEKKFKRRDIYYKEDIKKLKKNNIFYLNILHGKNESRKKDFIEVPYEKVKEAFYALKNGIFKKKNIFNNKKIIYASVGFIFLLLICFFEINLANLNFQKKKLLIEKEKLIKSFDMEKEKRGINDEKYKEFSFLIKKRSCLNSFFFNLYSAGRNNIRISNFDYIDENFTISGYCTDDSKLEDQIRDSEVWKDVEFNFTRENNRLKFIIKGKFIDERFNNQE